MLLMDKPFSSLDAPARESIKNLTMELWKEQNLTLVLITHAIEEAAVLVQKILLLGHPPNVSPAISDNLWAARPSFRYTYEYVALTRHLREKNGGKMNRRDLFLANLVFIIVWQVAAMVVQRPILPSPIEVSKIFMTDMENGQLAQQLTASL